MARCLIKYRNNFHVEFFWFVTLCSVGVERRPFDKFVDWRQCAAVMNKETVTVMPSCNGGGSVVVA
jgi:hypothetical protein